MRDLLEHDNTEFRNYIRMGPDVFEELVLKIEPFIRRQTQDLVNYLAPSARAIRVSLQKVLRFIDVTVLTTTLKRGKVFELIFAVFH